MYRPPLRSRDALRSELLWLESLRREAALPVPEPIPAEDGSLIRYVSAENAPERLLRTLTRRLPGGDSGSPRWLCALQRWVPGEHRKGSRNLSPEDLSRFGSYVARLHAHAERFRAPEEFARPRWSWEWVFGERAPVWHSGESFYSAPEMDVFRAAARRARRDLASLGEDRRVFGLIHRDLTPDNVLFHGESVCAVDFDSCGWGHYLLDLAGALMPLEVVGKRRASLQAALLDGYRRERPLPAKYREYLETFTAMRITAMVNTRLLHHDAQRTSPPDPVLSKSVERLGKLKAG